jgi:hypothetical protein
LQRFHRQCHEIDENPGQGFITGVEETGDNLSPVTTTPPTIKQSSPVTLTPEKIRNVPTKY